MERAASSVNRKSPKIIRKNAGLAQFGGHWDSRTRPQCPNGAKNRARPGDLHRARPALILNGCGKKRHQLTVSALISNTNTRRMFYRTAFYSQTPEGRAVHSFCRRYGFKLPHAQNYANTLTGYGSVLGGTIKTHYMEISRSGRDRPDLQYLQM